MSLQQRITWKTEIPLPYRTGGKEKASGRYLARTACAIFFYLERMGLFMDTGYFNILHRTDTEDKEKTSANQ